MSGRELARLLEHHGWSLARVNGAHHIYVKPGSRVRLSIPIHGNRPLRIGLLHHLVKQAGLNPDELT